MLKIGTFTAFENASKELIEWTCRGINNLEKPKNYEYIHIYSAHNGMAILPEIPTIIDTSISRYIAWNKCIKYLISQGCDYIGVIQPGSNWKPDTLEILVNELEKEDIVVSFAQSIVTNTFSTNWNDFSNNISFGTMPALLTKDNYKGILLNTCYLGNCYMYKANLHNEIGFLNEYFVHVSDYEFFLKASSKGMFSDISNHQSIWLEIPETRQDNATLISEISLMKKAYYRENGLGELI